MWYTGNNMLSIEKEIHEQPQVLQVLLKTQRETARSIAKALKEFQPAFVCIAARGTSDNAARYAQYLWGIHLRMPVMLATPSLHTLYDTAPDLSRALVIGVSQSGQPDDVRQVIKDAREQGAFTVAITNDAESPLAQEAQYHLPLCAGEEVSIAATKTYTAQLTALAMLASAIDEKTEHQVALAQLPAWVAETLKRTDKIAQWAERYRYMEHCISVGRGYNFCTAFEVNLKIQELCYLTGHGYSEADLRHGPIAMIQPGFPVVTVAPSGKALPLMLDLLDKLAEKQAECIVFSDNETALSKGKNGVLLPNTVPEWLTPVTSVIPGQVFAMHLALAKGYPVDKPRGLTKVTMTR
jgi:glutamine---fructose-6-phosphate transaminase (isomerizing)